MKKSLFCIVMIGICLTLLLFQPLCSADTAKSPDFLLPIHVNSKYGYIDSTGKIVVKPQYLETADFSEGLGAFKAKIKDKSAYGGYSEVYGFMNSKGKVVINAKFISVSGFHEGLARAGMYVKGKYKDYFINKAGTIVFTVPDNVSVNTLSNFSEGLLAFRSRETDLMGYLSKTGKIVIQPIYDTADDFSNGLALVNLDGKKAYIDKTGKVVIKADKYESCGRFSEGLASFTTFMGVAGYIDKTGKSVIEFGSNQMLGFTGHLEYFSEGLAEYWIDGKVGYVDKAGNVVIKPQYDIVGIKFLDSTSPQSFSDGLAAVRVSGAVGFIDKTGKLVIEPQFDFAEPFKYGVSRIKVNSNNKFGYIDKTGKVIWAPTK